jgi:hypothetical protein
MQIGGFFPVKILHGKMLMAAIILSCGLVMHADPPAPRSKAKPATVAEAWNWHMLGAAEASAHLAKPAETSLSLDRPASWH